MEHLAFKIVKLDGSHDQVIALAENFAISKAAFEKALFVYPKDHLETHQGARMGGYFSDTTTLASRLVGKE
jgi:hypothetical protein